MAAVQGVGVGGAVTCKPQLSQWKPDLTLSSRCFLTLPNVGASLVLIAACQEDRGSPERTSPATQTRDSAGIEIAENPRPPEGSSLGWEIGPEPTVTIGAAQGEAPYLLYDVRDASTLSDGRIVVADGASDEVRVFDPDGVEVECVEVWPLRRGSE